MSSDSEHNTSSSEAEELFDQGEQYLRDDPEQYLDRMQVHSAIRSGPAPTRPPRPSRARRDSLESNIEQDEQIARASAMLRGIDRAEEQRGPADLPDNDPVVNIPEAPEGYRLIPVELSQFVEAIDVMLEHQAPQSQVHQFWLTQQCPWVDKHARQYLSRMLPPEEDPAPIEHPHLLFCIKESFPKPDREMKITIDIDSVILKSDNIPFTSPFTVTAVPETQDTLRITNRLYHNVTHPQNGEFPEALSRIPNIGLGKNGRTQVNMFFPRLYDPAAASKSAVSERNKARLWDDVIRPSLQHAMPHSDASLPMSWKFEWTKRWKDQHPSQPSLPSTALGVFTRHIRHLIQQSDELSMRFGNFFFLITARSLKSHQKITVGPQDLITAGYGPHHLSLRLFDRLSLLATETLGGIIDLDQEEFSFRMLRQNIEDWVNRFNEAFDGDDSLAEGSDDAGQEDNAADLKGTADAQFDNLWMDFGFEFSTHNFVGLWSIPALKPLLCVSHLVPAQE